MYRPDKPLEHSLPDLFAETLHLLFHLVGLVQEYHKRGHFLFLVVGCGFIDLLDQTGQAVVDLASKDRDDGTTPVGSDQAGGFAGVRARYVLGVERLDRFSDGDAGFDFRKAGTAYQQHASGH